MDSIREKRLSLHTVVDLLATLKSRSKPTAINTVADLEAIWASNEAPVEGEINVVA